MAADRHTPLTRRAFLRSAVVGLVAAGTLESCTSSGGGSARSTVPGAPAGTPVSKTTAPAAASGSGLLAGATPSPGGGAPFSAQQTSTAPAALPSPAPDDAPSTAATLPAVPLELQIGQMLLVGFRGLSVTAEHPIIGDIREHHLGGVVLFDYDVPAQSPVRNVQSPTQLWTLVRALQAAAATPLFVTIDQEGGRVARLSTQAGFPPTVSAQYLGRINDLEITRGAATTIAKTLRQVGININLAPVVDLNSNPTNPVIGGLERSFSADPAIVAKHALAFIAAHHAEGILCTLKHFPGHGSSTADSHLGLVDVTRSWSRRELSPYTSLLAARSVDAIMTAHVFNANLDPDHPATLSLPIVSGLLRHQLAYDGVVISDDMQMGAITQQYGFDAAVELAIKAGVDILTLGNNLVYEEGIAGRTIALIGRLVAEGKVAPERISASFLRIQRLKQRLARATSHRRPYAAGQGGRWS